MGIRANIIGNPNDDGEAIKRYLGSTIVSIEGLRLYYSRQLHEEGTLLKVGFFKTIQDTDIFKVSDTFIEEVVTPVSEVLGNNAWRESCFSVDPLDRVVARLLGSSAASIILNSPS